MGRASNRKRPITLPKDSTGIKAISSRETRKRISAYHNALRASSHSTIGPSGSRNDTLHTSRSEESSDGATAQALVDYQRASLLGQSKERGGDSSKVLIKWLRDRNLDEVNQIDRTHVASEAPEPYTKRRLLEIGALTHDNFRSCSTWLDNHPIDLHSNHPRILQQDFFQRPLPNCEADQFDIISCSLVLNFVAEPRQRGRMLQLIHAHLKPRNTSLLFLVLPLACVLNSRYTSLECLSALMRVIGFDEVQTRFRPGGKVIYWLWAWREPSGQVEPWRKKQEVSRGSRRNNFSILLP